MCPHGSGIAASGLMNVDVVRGGASWRGRGERRPRGRASRGSLGGRRAVAAIVRSQPARAAPWVAAGVAALVSAAALLVPLQARTEPLVLSDRALDGVTAGGLALVSDAFAVANGFGVDALADTTTISNVDPGLGSAVLSAVAVGPEGADGVGVATVTGVDANGGEHAVVVSADSFTPTSEPVSIDAIATLQGDDGGVEGAGTGIATGTNSGTRSSTSLDHRVGGVRIEALGTVDSIGSAAAPAFADTAAGVRTSGSVTESVVRTAGSSPEFSDGFAAMAVSAEDPNGDADMVMSGSAVTSQTGGAGAAEVGGRVVDEGRMRMGVMTSRASTVGDGAQDVSATTDAQSTATGGLNLGMTRASREDSAAAAATSSMSTATSTTTVIHVKPRAPRR